MLLVKREFCDLEFSPSGHAKSPNCQGKKATEALAFVALCNITLVAKDWN
jgi:hypothetical protein